MSGVFVAVNKSVGKTFKIQELPGLPFCSVQVEQVMNFAAQAVSASLYFVAEYQLKQLAAAFPKLLEVRLKLLELAAITGNGELADAMIAELEKLKVKRVDLLPVLTQLALSRGDADTALQLTQKLMLLKPNSSKVYFALAEVYQALAEKDKAVVAFDAAIARNPKPPEPYYLRGLLLKRQLNDSQREQLDAALAVVSETEVKPYVMLNLAKAWSNYGDVEAEFHYLDKAKQRMAVAYQWSADWEWERFLEIADFSNARRLQEAKLIDNSDDAPVFIIGMARSGTTLLETILSAHPDFFPTGERHIISYACDQIGLSRGKNGAFWQWGGDHKLDELLAGLHQRVMQHDSVKAAAGRRWVDKSLASFKHTGLIKMIYPRAKFIHLRRDPMAVCLSNYQHYIVKAHSMPVTLEHLAQYCQIFTRAVEHWKALFSDDILTVDYESLTNDFEVQLRKLLAFLGADWNDACLKFHEQKTMVMTPSTMQVRTPINQDAEKRWMRYEKQLAPVARILNL